jgi:lipopolysaccharide export LptBFGC system permease protein LptF
MLIKKNMGIFAIVVLLVATVVIYANPIPSAAAQPKSRATTSTQIKEVPIATSGSTVYMAWPNNDTGHWNVFFAKNTDGGKTLKTMMISAPNNGNTIDQNTQISASGNNVYVTWWTNKTGTLMPVFRASNDGGNTFAKAITLNSTAG